MAAGVKRGIDEPVAFIREAQLWPYCDLQGVVGAGFIANAAQLRRTERAPCRDAEAVPSEFSPLRERLMRCCRDGFNPGGVSPD